MTIRVDEKSFFVLNINKIYFSVIFAAAGSAPVLQESDSVVERNQNNSD
jgi:hypothetical protein